MLLHDNWPASLLNELHRATCCTLINDVAVNLLYYKTTGDATYGLKREGETTTKLTENDVK